MAVDPYQQSNFKSLDHVTQSTVTTQREPDSGSDSPASKTAALINGLENRSVCDYIPTESDDFVANHTTGENLVGNMKSEDAYNNKHSNDLCDAVHETDELSTAASPATNNSDSELSEHEEIGIFASKVQVDCNNTIRKESEVHMGKSEYDDVKPVFESEVVVSFKKMPRERKQKYPARCDIKSEESKPTSISKTTSDHEDQFSCVLCGLGFAQEQLLTEHTQSHCDSSNEIDTVICQKTGPASEDDEPLDRRLERHLKKVEILHSEPVPRKFLCQYCNKYFEFVSQLNRHRKCHSSDEKEATPCRHCGKKYTHRACLIKHESQHTGTGAFKCKQCDDGFNSKQEYRSHRAKQHGKQWSCSECHRSFSNSSNLKNHYNNKHLGHEAKSYACNICGKLFKQKGNLKVHVDSRCGSEPRHVCSVCGKAFMSGGSLGTHSLLHTGEKTFLCRFCGKNFRLKVEMQRHERSHTGEKPFVCKVCNKAFAHRESLVTHNTLHTGIRPYMCEACGSTFSCIGNLIKHRQTHNRRCDIARQ
ncbi:hypothetical protein B7P43_G17233 [Cryptotermes secundus]|uniref:C2H2-type domain-containing protein n=2 Tax=Cryptotermes secundus TaxID=105785 RepID=A0A2J7RGI6_9NEOP|nr:hypothetical protein B7P43_G17233 [Cryptotermes secundus]PNF39942.1 hypothetical protein B7P43_G17233 [Cryptotermes secundus]